MMDKVLQEIVEAEETAAGIEASALSEARAVVQAARESAHRTFQEGILMSERRVADELAAFDARARAEMKEMLTGTAQTAREVQTDADARMQAAVALIVEGVLGKYGDS